LGELLLRRKETAESVACLQKAVSLDPKSGKAHTYLGKAYLQQGKSEEALRSFQTAVRVDPGYAGGHYQLGLLYRIQGRNKEAQEEMKLFEGNRDKPPSAPQILE
jgi:Tfp pilus assembly protein PilF